jgi:transcriptional regulator with XRE-family HTH domain
MAKMDPNGNLATLLRQARLDRGVSQSALARRTGVPQPAISRFENGRETPSLQRFGRLVAGLGLRPDLELAPLAAHRGDAVHAERVRRMTPGERLEQAAEWSGFASELRGRARAA